MASSRLGYLALKKEATRGVAVKPTNFVRHKGGGITYNQEIIANNPIQNTRHNAINAVKGKVTTDGEYSLDMDLREIGYWLYAVLGTVGVTNSAGVYTHTFSQAKKLPSFSLEQCKGDGSDTDYEVSRAFGVLCDSLEISGSDGLLEAKVGLKAIGIFLKTNAMINIAIGAPSTIDVQSTEGLVATDAIKVIETKGTLLTESTTITAITDTDTLTATIATTHTLATTAPKIELAAQSPSFPNAPLTASFANCRFRFGDDLTLAASATPENVENWTFTFENGVEERFGSLRNSPSKLAEKGSKGTLKFSQMFETKTLRDAYMDKARRACILTITLEDIISGTTAYSLNIRMNDLRFTMSKMDTGSDEIFVLELESEIFYNSTDGKALEMVLITGVTDYTA